MDDLFMNANSEEVVQPQEETQEEREVVSPEDMSDEDFGKHIEGLKNGTAAPRDEITPPAAPEEAGAAKEPFKSFETQEEFQNFMNSTIGERLKSARAEKEKYESYGKRAMSFYGGDTYEEAIGKMLDDVETQFAASAGKSKEEFAADQQLKMDAFAYRRERAEAKAREDTINAIQAEWAREEAALKAAVPGFELGKAMQNPDFKQLVLNEGMSLSAAYIKLTSGKAPPQERPAVTEVGNDRGKVSSQGAKDYLQMDRDEFMASMNRITGKRG